MARSTQTLHTCDRCGLNTAGPLGTRKKPAGWKECEAVIPTPDAGDGAGVAAVDLCPACVQSALGWWLDVTIPAKSL